MIFERTARTLRVGFEAAVRRARFDGEVPRSLNPADAASFLLTTLQGLRVTAKATGDRQVLTASVDLVLRALGKEIRLWRRRPFACPQLPTNTIVK